MKFSELQQIYLMILFAITGIVYAILGIKEKVSFNKKLSYLTLVSGVLFLILFIYLLFRNLSTPN